MSRKLRGWKLREKSRRSHKAKVTYESYCRHPTGTSGEKGKHQRNQVLSSATQSGIEDENQKLMGEKRKKENGFGVQLRLDLGE